MRQKTMWPLHSWPQQSTGGRVDNFRLLENGKVTAAKRMITYDSTNIVYCIICPECREFYIGECKTLRARMNLHRNHSNPNNITTPPVKVNQHLVRGGAFLSLPVLHREQNWNQITREAYERHFQQISLHGERHSIPCKKIVFELFATAQCNFVIEHDLPILEIITFNFCYLLVLQSSFIKFHCVSLLLLNNLLFRLGSGWTPVTWAVFQDQWETVDMTLSRSGDSKKLLTTIKTLRHAK